MKFCNQCGGPLSLKVPEGDNRERHICDHCQHIHYLNPRIIAGCLVTQGEHILLCKRAIEPRKHFWTLPAGFMENGETTEDCAQRETWEEAKAEVELQGLYLMYSIPYINQVYLIFRATLKNGTFDVGPESSEVDLFLPNEIPWRDLAFPVMRTALELYLEDSKKGLFPTHTGAFDQADDAWRGLNKS